MGEDEVIVMLCTEPAFEKASRNSVTDAKNATEVLFSIDAGSRAEVDEIAKKAADAGGTVFGKPDVRMRILGSRRASLEYAVRDVSRMPKS